MAVFLLIELVMRTVVLLVFLALIGVLAWKQRSPEIENVVIKKEV